MHISASEIFNPGLQDDLQTFLKKAEIDAELQKPMANDVANHFIRFLQTSKATTAMKSNFKTMCLIYNCQSPMMLLYNA